MLFDEAGCDVLREEIKELADTLAVYVNVVDSRTGEVLGQAVIEVWNMIEHKCNILRHVSTRTSTLLCSH